MTDMEEHMKTCTGCRETKPLEAFSPNRGGAGGRASRCKVCRSSSQRAAYAADPEASRAASRASSRKYSQAHPERRRASTQKYVQDNPEQRRDTLRKYSQAHPEQGRANTAAYRARKVGAQTGPVDEAAAHSSRPDCYLCGHELAAPVELDHVVPLARGGAHTMANLLPTHQACNRRKADTLLADLDWYTGPQDPFHA